MACVTKLVWCPQIVDLSGTGSLSSRNLDIVVRRSRSGVVCCDRSGGVLLSCGRTYCCYHWYAVSCSDLPRVLGEGDAPASLGIGEGIQRGWLR